MNTWSLSSGIPHAVCRLGNVYGPRQSPHGEAGVVAIFAHHLYTGPGARSSTATARRPATTSTSAMSSARCWPRRGASGTYNIATGVETDVSDRLAASSARPPASEIEPGARGPAPGRAQHSCLDARLRRARARLARRGADRGRACASPTRRSSRNSSALAALRRGRRSVAIPPRTRSAVRRGTAERTHEARPRRSPCRRPDAAHVLAPSPAGAWPWMHRAAPRRPVCGARRAAASSARPASRSRRPVVSELSVPAHRGRRAAPPQVTLRDHRDRGPAPST